MAFCTGGKVMLITIDIIVFEDSFQSLMSSVLWRNQNVACNSKDL